MSKSSQPSFYYLVYYPNNVEKRYPPRYPNEGMLLSYSDERYPDFGEPRFSESFSPFGERYPHYNEPPINYSPKHYLKGLLLVGPYEQPPIYPYKEYPPTKDCRDSLPEFRHPGHSQKQKRRILQPGQLDK